MSPGRRCRSSTPRAGATGSWRKNSAYPPRPSAAGLRRQAEQRLAGELDTREIKELTAVLRELMNLQQTLEGQQPGGSPLRVVL